MRIVRRLLLGAAIAVAATSCSGTDSASRASSRRAPDTTADDLAPAPEQLTFFADYPRYLWHQRRLAIATTNHGDQPVEIVGIALRTGWFEWLPIEDKSTTIAPGARVDVQVDFGELVSCDQTPLGPAGVEITTAADGAGGPDGATTTTFLAEVDPAPLDEIRDRECARRRVTDAADIAFSAERTIDRETMATTIDIERLVGDDPIRVESLQGSVIIALRPAVDGEPFATLSATESSASIPVELFIARCEPHAVSQSTLTWVLSAFVSVGDAPPHKLALEVPDDMRDQLQAMIDECIAALPADN